MTSPQPPDAVSAEGRLTSQQRLLIRTCLIRHYNLVTHYRAPWDRAIDQVIEEVEAGTLVPPEGMPSAD